MATCYTELDLGISIEESDTGEFYISKRSSSQEGTSSFSKEYFDIVIVGKTGQGKSTVHSSETSCYRESPMPQGKPKISNTLPQSLNQ